jgi:hypothetical protein
VAQATPLTIAAMCSIGRELNTSISAGDRLAGPEPTASIATGMARPPRRAAAAKASTTLLTSPPAPRIERKPPPGTILA